MVSKSNVFLIVGIAIVTLIVSMQSIYGDMGYNNPNLPKINSDKVTSTTSSSGDCTCSINNYWTTNSTQTGLVGNKTSNATLILGSIELYPPLHVVASCVAGGTDSIFYFGGFYSNHPYFSDGNYVIAWSMAGRYQIRNSLDGFLIYCLGGFTYDSFFGHYVNNPGVSSGSGDAYLNGWYIRDNIISSIGNITLYQINATSYCSNLTGECKDLSEWGGGSSINNTNLAFTNYSNIFTNTQMFSNDDSVVALAGENPMSQHTAGFFQRNSDIVTLADGNGSGVWTNANITAGGNLKNSGEVTLHGATSYPSYNAGTTINGTVYIQDLPNAVNFGLLINPCGTAFGSCYPEISSPGTSYTVIRGGVIMKAVDDSTPAYMYFVSSNEAIQSWITFFDPFNNPSTDLYYMSQSGNHIFMDTVGNIGNITARNVCYSNGTGCNASGMNYTNVCLTNQSNILNGDLNVTGSLSATTFNATNINVNYENFSGDFYSHDQTFYFNSTSNNLTIKGQINYSSPSGTSSSQIYNNGSGLLIIG